jgi:thiamine biosynthesis lipoprotein
MLPHKIQFSAIGTQWQIDSQQPLSLACRRYIADRIELFDVTYSRFRDDSLVRALVRHAGKYTFPTDVVPLLTLYRQLYDLTDGQVTPLIGATLERAGYDAEYSFQARPQGRLPAWDEVMRWDQYQVQTSQPVTLDFGAAGKGYLVDVIAKIIVDDGITEFVIDASGDMLHHGTTDHIVGLEHPDDPSKVIGIMRVENASLCASATNRRRWGENLHHIFNPHTQSPVDSVIATWVVSETAVIADGLATALFFVGPEQLARQFTFSFVRLMADGSVEHSNDIKGELFV